MRILVIVAVTLLLGLAIGHVLGLILAAIVLGVGYWLSVRLSPRAPHQACGGTGRSHGWIFTSAHHKCAGCGGSGRVIRYGASRWGHPAVRDEAIRMANARAESKRRSNWR
jgi:hypothetical protein